MKKEKEFIGFKFLCAMAMIVLPIVFAVEGNWIAGLMMWVGGFIVKVTE